MTRLTRTDFVQGLENKRINVQDAQGDLRSRLQRADLDGSGDVSGTREAQRLFTEIDRLDRNGDADSIRTHSGRAPTQAGVLADQARQLATPDVRRGLSGQSPQPAAGDAGGPVAGARGGELGESVVSWNPNATAMDRARRSDLGRLAETEVPRHAETYQRASELTGVPAQLIAAIHGNESSFGTNRASTRGPESGYGLDDRWVSTSWGNQQLRRHGLGRWQRGQDTETGRLQSAVVAAEHLKRQAGYAGIEVGPNMSQNDIAGAITAYTTGIDAANAAERRGTSWMFNPSDANPHPLHPGGTSRTRRGTIRVAPSRKEGLLRWDTLLPLIEEQMRAGRAVS